MAELPLIKPARDLLSNTSVPVDLRPTIAASRRQSEALNFALDKITQAVTGVATAQKKKKDQTNQLIADQAYSELQNNVNADAATIKEKIINGEITNISELSVETNALYGYAKALISFDRNSAMKLNTLISGHHKNFRDELFKQQKSARNVSLDSNFNKGIDSLPSYLSSTLNNSALTISEKINEIQNFRNLLKDSIDISYGDQTEKKKTLNTRIDTLTKQETEFYITNTITSEKWLKDNNLERTDLYAAILTGKVKEFNDLIGDKAQYAETIRNIVNNTIQQEQAQDKEFVLNKKQEFYEKFNDLKKLIRKSKEDGITHDEATEINDIKAILDESLTLLGFEDKVAQGYRKFLEEPTEIENTFEFITAMNNKIINGEVGFNEIMSMVVGNLINEEEAKLFQTTYNNVIDKNLTEDRRYIQREFGVVEASIGSWQYDNVFKRFLPLALNEYRDELDKLEKKGLPINRKEVRDEVIKKYKTMPLMEQAQENTNKIVKILSDILDNPEEFDFYGLNEEDRQPLENLREDVKKSGHLNKEFFEKYYGPKFDSETSTEEQKQLYADIINAINQYDKLEEASKSEQ